MNKKKLNKPPHKSKDFSYDASKQDNEHWSTTLFCILGVFFTAGFIVWGLLSIGNYFSDLNTQVKKLDHDLYKSTQYCSTVGWVQNKKDLQDCFLIWNDR